MTATNPDPLDTTECPRCFALVQLDHVDDHEAWHASLVQALRELVTIMAAEDSAELAVHIKQGYERDL